MAPKISRVASNPMAWLSTADTFGLMSSPKAWIISDKLDVISSTFSSFPGKHSHAFMIAYPTAKLYTKALQAPPRPSPTLITTSDSGSKSILEGAIKKYEIPSKKQPAAMIKILFAFFGTKSMKKLTTKQEALKKRK